MTVTARQDAAPERLEPTPANRGYRGRLPSIGALYERPRECGGPMQIATPTHRAARRGLPTVQVSKRFNLNRDDANNGASGHIGVAADEIAANLLVFKVRPSLGLNQAARLVTLGVAAGVGGDHNMGHRLGGFAGNQVHGVHRSAPHFVATNIGPMALCVNREIP